MNPRSGQKDNIGLHLDRFHDKAMNEYGKDKGVGGDCVEGYWKSRGR